MVPVGILRHGAKLARQHRGMRLWLMDAVTGTLYNARTLRAEASRLRLADLVPDPDHGQGLLETHAEKIAGLIEDGE